MSNLDLGGVNLPRCYYRRLIHKKLQSLKDQYESDGEKISIAASSDAWNIPDVTEHKNVIPLFSMHPKMCPH